MEIFVEQGPSYEKCLKKINQKYGEDVTILRRKEAKEPRFLGFFERDFVEVTFGVQEKPVRKAPFAAEQIPAKPVRKLNDYEEQLKIIKGYADKNPQAAEKLRPYVDTIQKRTDETSEPVATKSERDRSYDKLLETVERLAAKIEKQQNQSADTEHTHIAKVAKILEENDFSLSYIKRLSIRLKNELTYTEIENYQTVQKKLFEILAESVKIKPARTEIKTRVILLVGPTGVGKTTTLAKIAAQYIRRQSKVNVITIDNWRIGAAYQMERYCELMGIKPMVASKPTEVRAFMDIYREEADVICIDTIGRSPNDSEKITQMQEYFTDIGEDAEIYLTICAGTRINDIREIMKQYKIFKYKSLIVTKFDETAYIGNLFSIIAETNIPITYITAGQAVPQDFLPASTEIFLNKLKGFSVEREYINQICNKDKNQLLKVSAV